MKNVSDLSKTNAVRYTRPNNNGDCTMKLKPKQQIRTQAQHTRTLVNQKIVSLKTTIIVKESINKCKIRMLIRFVHPVQKDTQRCRLEEETRNVDMFYQEASVETIKLRNKKITNYFSNQVWWKQLHFGLK